HFIAYGYLDLGFKPFVIFIFHNFSDSHILCRKLQYVIRLGVSWKPILAIDILSIGFKSREASIPILFGYMIDRFSVSLHDLQILLIDPDLTFEVALVFFNGLWIDIEDIGIKFIDLLFPQVVEIIFANTRDRKNEGVDVL